MCIRDRSWMMTETATWWRIVDCGHDPDRKSGVEGIASCNCHYVLFWISQKAAINLVKPAGCLKKFGGLGSTDRALQSRAVTDSRAQVVRCAVQVSCADWDSDSRSCAGDHCNTSPVAALNSQSQREPCSADPQPDSRRPWQGYNNNHDTQRN